MSPVAKLRPILVGILEGGRHIEIFLGRLGVGGGGGGGAGREGGRSNYR